MSGDRGGERFSVEKLRHRVPDVSFPAEVVKRQDVRMERAATAFASRSKRASESASSARRSGRTFTATSRPSRVSFAL